MGRKARLDEVSLPGFLPTWRGRSGLVFNHFSFHPFPWQSVRHKDHLAFIPGHTFSFMIDTIDNTLQSNYPRKSGEPSPPACSNQHFNPIYYFVTQLSHYDIVRQLIKCASTIATLLLRYARNYHGYLTRHDLYGNDREYCRVACAPRKDKYAIFHNSDRIAKQSFLCRPNQLTAKVELFSYKTFTAFPVSLKVNLQGFGGTMASMAFSTSPPVNRWPR
jgi:hypothetical protein